MQKINRKLPTSQPATIPTLINRRMKKKLPACQPLESPPQMIKLKNRLTQNSKNRERLYMQWCVNTLKDGWIKKRVNCSPSSDESIWRNCWNISHGCSPAKKYSETWCSCCIDHIDAVMHIYMVADPDLCEIKAKGDLEDTIYHIANHCVRSLSPHLWNIGLKLIYQQVSQHHPEGNIQIYLTDQTMKLSPHMSRPAISY